MKLNLEVEESLLIERKIRMHEAREGIIDRLARDLPASIDINRFLDVIVSEIGRMMEADRCDVIELNSNQELIINHEWRRTDEVPSSLGTKLPIDLEKLSQRIDISSSIAISNTAEIKDPTLKFFAKALETKSLLVIPISVNSAPVGLLGVHQTSSVRNWEDEEISFLESIARQMAIGYQYTRLYVTQESETKRTTALLEIANTLNSHSDFKEVSDRVLEKAVELVGADYGALGVLDGDSIVLASFKVAHGRTPGKLIEMIGEHGKSLPIGRFKAIKDILVSGQSTKLLDTQLPLAIRLAFNSQLQGKQALVTPVRVGGKAFGLLGFVWGERDEHSLRDHEVALVEGIADQIGTALERDQLSAEVMKLKSELHQRNSEIVGQSAAIRRVVDLAMNVAPTATTVLIQGESGTGKELVANLIHYNSGRENKPYIKINCGAIPETLLESELFGHEKGAFTDAKAQRKGRFEEADGGTLFLDEIGEMPLAAQVKLLRVLQDGELTRIGGKNVIKTDVRVIAATNTNLEKAIDMGGFRKDLYYRLSVFPITVPPLRERVEDISLLVFYFLEQQKLRTSKFISGISKEAMSALVAHGWLGNVRELENVVERAVILASGGQIEIGNLPDGIAKTENLNFSDEIRLGDVNQKVRGHLELKVGFPASIDQIEKEAIVLALEFTSGDKSKAAKVLNIGRKTLYRKLTEYGIG